MCRGHLLGLMEMGYLGCGTWGCWQIEFQFGISAGFGSRGEHELEVDPDILFRVDPAQIQQIHFN